MLGVESAGSVLTPTRLEAMWPEARHRIVTSLCAAGVDLEAAEEAMAEAATRALARGLVVEDLDEFCRWAFVVARNVVVDGGRRSRRVVLIDVVPERIDHYDLAGHVETRQRLEEATRVIARMSPIDRHALLDNLVGGSGEGGGGGGVGDRKQAVKQAVRRYRARARLLHALGAPAGWLTPLRLPKWVGRLSRTPEAAMAAAAAVAVPLMAATLLAPPTATAGEPAPVSDVPAPSSAVVPATVEERRPVVAVGAPTPRLSPPPPTPPASPPAPAVPPGPPESTPPGEMDAKGRTVIELDPGRHLYVRTQASIDPPPITLHETARPAPGSP